MLRFLGTRWLPGALGIAIALGSTPAKAQPEVIEPEPEVIDDGAELIEDQGPGLIQPGADTPSHRREALVLPEAPEGFVREQRGAVRWEYPRRARSVARDLQTTYDEHWPRVVAELGMPIDEAMIIRIGRNPDQMRALAPMGAPPPAYASGVAYPHAGVVLLTLTAPDSWERPHIDQVLVHELSHVALHRAADGTAVPRWFSEGVAVHQAGEHGFERMRTLWRGTVGGRLISLNRLSRSFPSHPHHVSLAYAQSADFVRWLLDRPEGNERFHELIRRLQQGQPFETAMRRTYSLSMGALEVQWHENLGERFQALPLLVGSGGLWVFASLLLVLAYFKRRRQDRRRLAQWEREEKAAMAANARSSRQMLEASESGWAAKTPVRRIGVPANSAESSSESNTTSTQSGSRASGDLVWMGDSDQESVVITPPEPRRRESGVPTVEHDGRSHTLH